MSLPPFDIEKLTADFLFELTQLHAGLVHKETNGEYGNDSNWFEGRKLTTVTIFEQYLKECKEKDRCLEIPECCCEYLKEIDIQDLKKYKAYLRWVENGKKKDNSPHIEQAEYLEGCNDLMDFCTCLHEKNKKCVYDDLLATIDRRTGRDRRENRGGNIKRPRVSRGPDRRNMDHRGDAAVYLTN